MARIVLSTFGSYGDLFPYIAIARRLRDLGHESILAGPANYRGFVEGLGVGFAPLRPEVDFSDVETMRRIMDAKSGGRYVRSKILAPRIRETYADLEVACDGADVLTSHALTYAAPILAEVRGLPWLSTVLMPMNFGSVHQPPALSALPAWAKMRVFGPRITGLVWRAILRASWSWSEPIRAFRAELGLDPNVDPLFEGQHSPRGCLALFSREFAEPQPDWPIRTTVCGWPFLDVDFASGGGERELEAFLAAGPPPLAFCLGSAAVHAAGDFYELAAGAARALGRRAVLVHGNVPVPFESTDDFLLLRSINVSSLFAGAELVVHAGGVGTTGQVMRAGKPQLVVPFAHDHFDNGVTLGRLGIGESMPRKSLNARSLRTVLERLLNDEGVRERAVTVGARVAAEDGADAAARAILELVPQTGNPSESSHSS